MKNTGLRIVTGLDDPYNSGIEKQAVLPFLAIGGALFKALMAAGLITGGIGAAKSGTKAVQAATKGNWRAAGKAGLSTLGNALLLGMGVLPGGQLLGKGIKGLRMARMAGMAGKGGRIAQALTKIPAQKLTQAARAAGKMQSAGAPFFKWPSFVASMALPTTVPGQKIPGQAAGQVAKAAQDMSALQYRPAVAMKTLGDLFRAVRADAGLSLSDKAQLINQIKGMTGFAAESTPLSALMLKGLGGTIGWLISKYFGMGAVGQLVSAATGYGIGKVIHNHINRPPDPYPGYRMLS